MPATYLYLGFVALLIGVAVGTLLTLETTIFVGLGGSVLFLLLFWLRTGKQIWLGGCLLIMILALGAWRAEIHQAQFGLSVLAQQVGEQVDLTGTVTREPMAREATLQLYVRVGDDLLLVTTDRHARVFYGDVVRVVGVLREPEVFITDLGRTFDYPQYLLARGVEYQISFAEVAVIGAGEGNWLIYQLLTFKQNFLTELNEYLPEPTAGLGAGLLLGVRQALGEELETAFRETGIIHIVVLSGYNIMLVVIFITFILGSFLSVRAKFVAGVLGIAAFALMVGLSATVLRACIMAGIMLFAEATGRRYLALRALCVAGAIMLLINPSLLLFDLGFQLSFLATFGLIILAPYVAMLAPFVPERLQLRQFFAATISTQIAVLPLLMYQIGQVSLVGVLVNMLVLPMVPIAMFTTFILGMLGMVLPVLAPVAAVPAYFSLLYIITLAEYFAAWPLAAAAVPTFTFLGMALLYLAYALGIFWLLRYRPLESGLENNQALLTPSNQQTTDLTGWTIKEEFDAPIKSGVGMGGDQKGGATPRVAPPENTPSFFR